MNAKTKCSLCPSGSLVSQQIKECFIFIAWEGKNCRGRFSQILSQRRRTVSSEYPPRSTLLMYAAAYRGTHTSSEIMMLAGVSVRWEHMLSLFRCSCDYSVQPETGLRAFPLFVFEARLSFSQTGIRSYKSYMQENTEIPHLPKFI